MENDFITTAGSILTEGECAFVGRLAAVSRPEFKAVLNKDLVGDRELLEEAEKAVIYDEDKK